MALTQREERMYSKQITILATAAGVADLYDGRDLADRINALVVKLDDKRKAARDL